MIDWLMNKAKFYDNKINNTMIRSFQNCERNPANPSSSSRRVLSAPSKKKRKELNAGELLTYNFPTRFVAPSGIHTPTTTEKRGTCVVCASKWPTIKHDDDDARPPEFTVPEFQREVKRTVKHCSYCSLFSREGKTSFLCKYHFKEFHQKWRIFDTTFLTRIPIQYEARDPLMCTSLEFA